VPAAATQAAREHTIGTAAELGEWSATGHDAEYIDDPCGPIRPMPTVAATALPGTRRRRFAAPPDATRPAAGSRSAVLGYRSSTHDEALHGRTLSIARGPGARRKIEPVALLRRRRLVAAAMIGGALVIATAQRLAPVGGPPLYDGVVVADPYRWLSPPPGLLGGARSIVQSTTLVAGQSGELADGTPEVPPQAQVIADFGSLDLPAGTTSITVSIAPIPAPDVAPPDGVVAGNVYRISATNQQGTVVPVRAEGRVTMLFRGPPSMTAATIEVFSDGTWTAAPTDPAGIPDMFTAIVSGFGVFALVAPPGWLAAGESAVPAASSTASAEAISSAASAASTATSGAPISPAPSAGSAASTAPTEPAAPPTSSGSPWAPIAAGAVALLVLLAAAAVLMRPLKPPGE